MNKEKRKWDGFNSDATVLPCFSLHDYFPTTLYVTKKKILFLMAELLKVPSINHSSYTKMHFELVTAVM